MGIDREDGGQSVVRQTDPSDAQPPGRPNVPRVGAVAPDFRLPNTSRETRRLDDMVANRPVILVFYRGYW